MTAQCGGGTSAPKAGVAVDALYTAASVASLFDLAGVPWLIPILAFVDIGAFALTTFCAGDPPAMPSFTKDEVNALLQLQLGADFSSGLAKMPALVANVIWGQYCHCTGGALVPFVYPTQPAGSNVYVGPTPGAPSPCFTDSRVRNTLGQNNTFGGWFIWTGYPVTGWSITLTGVPTVGAGSRMSILFSPVDANGVETVGGTEVALLCPASGSSTLIHDVPPGAAGIEIDYTSLVDGGQSDVTVALSAYCGVYPGATATTPCCPPDPIAQAQLDMILQLVTLIQRQAVPFGYLTGTAHAGLTGSGTISVSSLLGVLATVTAYPAGNTVIAGEPNYVYDLGWLSIETADGFIDEVRLRNTTQVWTPRIMSTATKIGYSLRAGVTATITELAREP